jgi:hypothetical protein
MSVHGSPEWRGNICSDVVRNAARECAVNNRLDGDTRVCVDENHRQN